LNFVKASSEELANVLVPFTKLGQHLFQQDADFAFRKRRDLRADSDGALVAHEMKRPEQHSRAVGI
jgi:hypothetical protein